MLNSAMTDEMQWNEITLPIRKICGLRVECGIKVRKHKNQVLLVIRSDVFYENEDICRCDDKYSLLRVDFNSNNKDSLEQKIENVIQTLKNLTFNKYSGKLDIKKEEEKKQTWNDAWFGILCKVDYIEMIDAECCVCLCRTITRTPCKHPICFECADQITYVDNDDYDGEEIPCPLCRADIQYGLN